MDDYKALVNSSPVVFIEFYASWCPHCRRMMPVVAEIRELLGGSLPIYQFDIDQNQKAATEAGAETIPTFIIYRDGEPVWRHSGEMEGRDLLQSIKQYM